MKKILCITDPLSHTPVDSTVELYQRLALDDDIVFYHAHPRAISEKQTLSAVKLRGELSFPDFQALDARPVESLGFSELALVFSRVDDPLPRGYMESLAFHESQTRFINSPSGLLEAGARSFHQKIAAKFLPDWIATRAVSDAVAFIVKFGDVVAKINQSYGGKGVRRIRRNDVGWCVEHHEAGIRSYAALETLLGDLFALDPEPFEFVRFLKNIGEGDKRVLVLDGKILGSYLRRSKGGGWVHNGTLGGYEERCEIGTYEREVISATWPEYARRNLQTLGYDFLMDDNRRWVLSEINAGNVGGYGQLARLTGEPIFEQLISWMKQR